MSNGELEQTVKSIDVRVARIEQQLPMLATREELKEAIAPLATREELRSAIAPLATREEMYAAIHTAAEAARRHATMLFEDLRDDNRIVLEHLVALSSRVDALARR